MVFGIFLVLNFLAMVEYERSQDEKDRDHYISQSCEKTSETLEMRGSTFTVYECDGVRMVLR